MKSDQKNILYFLTGRINGFVTSTLELGANQNCTEVISNRFKSRHEILLCNKKKHLSKGYTINLPNFEENYKVITNTFNNIVRKHFHSDLVICSVNLNNFLDEEDIDTSLYSFIFKINKVHANYVIIIDYEDHPAFADDKLKNVFAEFNYSVIATGSTVKRSKKNSDEYPEKILKGYLFSRREGM